MIINQYSRLSQHTITTTGATFSVPSQEDFTLLGTSSSWTPNDLALSEIGVNEADATAFIRIGNGIYQFGLSSGSSSSTASIWYDNGSNEIQLQPPYIAYTGVLPQGDDTTDLGSPTFRWRDLYLGSTIDCATDLDVIVRGTFSVEADNNIVFTNPTYSFHSIPGSDFIVDAGKEVLLTAITGNVELESTIGNIVFITGTFTNTFPITSGSPNQFLQTDGAGQLSWATASGGGSASPGGITYSFQFNNSGSFEGFGVFTDSSLYFNYPFTNGATGANNTFVGIISGLSNTTGSNNTFVGYQSGRDNTIGTGNTFNGQNSGISNTTGVSNTFMGKSSGASNTTGFENVFIGANSGLSNTFGNSNTFMGFCSGNSNTTGCYNTFIGRESGNSNTTGSFNTFIGYSGYFNTIGTNNTFIGTNAGICNDASCNTFVGSSSGFNNQTGVCVTAIGAYSGYSNLASCNTFIGTNAGCNNNNGTRNTFIGNDSGFFNSTGGNDNTYVGFLSGATSSISCAIALGRGARPIYNGDFAIGSAAAPINLGTTFSTPSITPLSDTANWMCVIVNGSPFKIPLYN